MTQNFIITSNNINNQNHFIVSVGLMSSYLFEQSNLFINIFSKKLIKP